MLPLSLFSATARDFLSRLTLCLRVPTLLIGWLLLFSVSGSAAEVPSRLVIDLPAYDASEPQDYYVDLLKMALEESRKPGEDIVYRQADRAYSQARWLYLLQHTDENLVVWTMTSKSREALLLPVRVPLYKGLFGQRVFIIRKQDQPRFSRVKTLDDLKELVAGQGIHWPDVDIFEANNLRVTTASRVDSLFKMLRAGRFDYYPRAVTEAWFELERQQDETLAVEESLMLIYPTAVYYFVNPGNTELANRIENGLERLIDSGKFDAFFYSHPRIKEGLAALGQSPRRIIHLKNPYLPDIMPPHTARYWLDGDAEMPTDATDKSGVSE